MFQKFPIITNKSANIVFFVLAGLIEFSVIWSLSDLPPELLNWRFKVNEILNLQIPSDNFYGPGGALLLLPFFWNSPNFNVANFFYIGIGLYFYCKLTQKIENLRYRFLAQMALLINVYLFWLCVSSQDTVFEFALYMIFLFFALNKKWGIALTAAFLLAQTRAGYWGIFVIGIVILSIIEYKKYKKIEFIKLLIIPIFVISSLFNFINYNSFSPALEGGMTAYFSYAKNHYLSLPKFDMDVFLSGEKGDFQNPKLQYELLSAKNQAQVDKIYWKYALQSIKDNPKQTILGWMQKFESHLVTIQKVPNLPGRYVLNKESSTINIENERLNWPLILGNLVYEIYRFCLLFGGLLVAGMYFVLRKSSLNKVFESNNFNYIFIFWLPSIVSAIIFYSETRFKIVQELSLIPLILFLYSKTRESMQKKSQ